MYAVYMSFVKKGGTHKMAFSKRTNKTGKDECKINTVEPIRSKEHIAQIIDFFEQRGWHKYTVIFMLGIYTGLRISDILALKVRDVKGKQAIWIREIKTGKVRCFSLNDILNPVVQDYVKDKEPDAWVFDGNLGNHLDRTQAYRRINEACEYLEIEANVGTHTLRKTFGYHMYKKHKNIALLQGMFNHTSPDVTLRYIGITQEEEQQAILELDLRPDTQDVEYLPQYLDNNSRVIKRRLVNFCESYINGQAKLHVPFAKMILEIIEGNSKRKNGVKGF